MKDEKDIVGFWNWGDNVKGLKKCEQNIVGHAVPGQMVFGTIGTSI